MNKSIVILNNPHCCSRHYINTDMSNIGNIFFVEIDVEIVKLLLKTFRNVVLKNKKETRQDGFTKIMLTYNVFVLIKIQYN